MSTTSEFLAFQKITPTMETISALIWETWKWDFGQSALYWEWHVRAAYTKKISHWTRRAIRSKEKTQRWLTFIIEIYLALQISFYHNIAACQTLVIVIITFIVSLDSIMIAMPTMCVCLLKCANGKHFCLTGNIPNWYASHVAAYINSEWNECTYLVHFSNLAKFERILLFLNAMCGSIIIHWVKKKGVLCVNGMYKVEINLLW